MNKYNVSIFFSQILYEKYSNTINFDNIFSDNKVNVLPIHIGSHNLSLGNIFDGHNLYKGDVGIDKFYKTNFDTLVSFKEYEYSDEISSFLSNKKMHLVEYIVYDSFMNKIVSVIFPNNRLSIEAQQNLLLFKKSYTLFQDNHKINIFESESDARLFLKHISYRYKITKYFGIYNMISYFVSDSETVQNFLQIMLLISEKYKVSLINHKKCLQVFSNLTHYADEQSIINYIN